MKLYFDDDAFDGQLQRSVGKADSGMANVGECLAIAEQITPGDRDSWYRAWSGFATRLAEQGQAALTAGHRVSARSVLLRAAEYFRQAFFFHRDDLDGEELRTAYASSVKAFQDALPLLDYQAEVLTEGLSGYLFTPRHPDGRLPPSSMSAGMTALPKSCTTRWDPRSTAAMSSPLSRVLARDRSCMTSGSRCAPTGRRWFPEWSMR